jgi:hypothetical protein
MLDLLAAEVAIVRNSSLPDADKQAEIREITQRAEYLRDCVDRLTDLAEGGRDRH